MDESGIELPQIKQPEKLPTNIPKVPEVTVEKPQIGQPEKDVIHQIEKGDKSNPDETLKNIAGSSKTTPETTFTPSQKPSTETAEAKEKISPENPFMPKTETQETDDSQPKIPRPGGAKEAWERASLNEKLQNNDVIDLIKNSDGTWSTRSPDDPNFFYKPKPEAIGVVNNQTSSEKPSSPKEHWERSSTPKVATIVETPEQKSTRLETERQEELQKLRSEGSKLSSLIYTPEGQQKVMEVRSVLDSIVEASIKKPHHESDFGWDKRQDEIAEAKARNNQRIQEWQQEKDERVSRLLNGESMNNLEQDAYLSSILGPDYKPGLDSAEEKKKKDLLVEQFNKLKSEIGKALDYQKSDSFPTEQSTRYIDETKLNNYGISLNQSQESFATGWNEKKNQGAKEMNSDEESTKVESVHRKPGQALNTPMR